MFPKHNGVTTISEYFALNLIILYHSQTNNYLLHYIASLNKISYYAHVKLIEYNFSAVSVCSNPCVGALLRIK